MQPVKTTPLRASEAVRSLNAVNNREAGGMVMFRTGIGLKEGLVAEEGIAATRAMRGSWLVSASPTFLLASAVKPTSSPC